MKARIPNQPQGGRNDMMAKLQKMQEDMARVQEEVENTEFTTGSNFDLMSISGKNSGFASFTTSAFPTIRAVEPVSIPRRGSKERSVSCTTLTHAPLFTGPSGSTPVTLGLKACVFSVGSCSGSGAGAAAGDAAGPSVSGAADSSAEGSCAGAGAAPVWWSYSRINAS